MIGNDLFYDAANRIRWCLIILNTVDLCIGVVLIIVGSTLCYHIERSPDETVPQLWMVGIPQMIFGIIGIASLIHAQKITVLAWLVSSTVMLPLSFLLFTMTDCFNTASFGVHLQVYGNCTNQNNVCKCTWPNATTSLVIQSSNCEDIRRATSLYVTLISILVIGLVLMVIIIGMGYIMTLCIKYCIPKEVRPLYSSCSTANGMDVTVGGMFRSSKADSQRCRNLLTVPVLDQENSTSSERTLLAS